MMDPDMKKKAACRGVGPAMFFPEGEEHTKERLAAQAIQVCDSCVVRTACKQEAESRGERTGIWGGVWFDYTPRTPGHWYIAVEERTCTTCNAVIPSGVAHKFNGQSTWCANCATTKGA